MCVPTYMQYINIFLKQKSYQEALESSGTARTLTPGSSVSLYVRVFAWERCRRNNEMDHVYQLRSNPEFCLDRNAN